MALMDLTTFKTLLNIQDTTYDASFAIYEPIAESRLNCYVGYTIEALAVGYTPYYARLIMTFITEGEIKVANKDVSSESFDGASFTYKDDGSNNGVAINTDSALLKFKPMKLRAY